ncbi:hypothetical protein [Ectopseudomonas composti]|uniref:hypothetical protein n=1 Tax=Ectopseudomonas composti TaxID=658457 RepID=UPI0018D2497E|nr:hypothetical protein [Pseudomonas composti]
MWSKINRQIKELMQKFINKESSGKPSLKVDGEGGGSMSGKEFSRREWLFAVAVLMMAEYWLISVSYTFVGWQEVVNFISFAAAIASILLAVIAIIYGFIQSESGAKTSGMLKEQAEDLRKYIPELSSSSSSISKQLEKISSIASRLDDLDTNMRSSIDIAKGMQDHVKDMSKASRAMLDALAEKKQGTESASVIKDGMVSVSELLDVIFRRSTYHLDLLSYALMKYSESNENLSVFEFLDKYYSVIEPDNPSIPLHSLHSVLPILKMVKAVDYKGFKDSFVVKDKLREALPVFVEEVLNSTADTVVEGVRRIDVALDKGKK